MERALRKEGVARKPVLFPLRLDDAVFDWGHALQVDVTRKVIGDFRNWRSPERYSAALERLIQDLQAC